MTRILLAFTTFTLFILAAVVTASAAPTEQDAGDVVSQHRHNSARSPSTLSRMKGHSRLLESRDAYTDLRETQDAGLGPTLTDPGARPAGAVATNIPVGNLGATLFAWQSKTPKKESDAKEVFIILHGVKRNAGTYFSILNNAWAKARDADYGNADEDSIRLAPLLFSTERDSEALNATTLAWADPNVWTGGDGSTHPPMSDISVFTVLDALLDRYANRSKYPKMRTVTFLAHGGGGQVIQRYAVLGKDSPRSAVKVRYVVGDPSSMLYFTVDRPVPVDEKACPRFNDFRYGFSDYNAPYSLQGRGRSALYKRYISRDVRYAIGESDTRIDKGDQSCMGRAAGGPYRRDRSLDYWAYLHLLGGANKIPDYPGWFPALDSDAVKAQANKNTTGYITSTPTSRRKFPKKANIQHKLFTVPDAGHSAKAVLGSSEGREAIFGS